MGIRLDAPPDANDSTTAEPGLTGDVENANRTLAGPGSDLDWTLCLESCV